MRPLHLIVLALLIASVAPAAATTVTPTADLRVRQEVFDGVLHFLPDPDVDWIRVRTRAGARIEGSRLGLELRLCNEHRHWLHPDVAFDWDELIVDRAALTWRPGERTTVTLGRQDIVWPGGFLVAERSPLDGSRAVFQDGLRLQLDDVAGGLDLLAVRNLERDHWVLAGDDHSPLQDTDESAAGLRVVTGPLAWAVIGKREHDPDRILPPLLTWTVDLRATGALGDGGEWEAEAAVQNQRRKDHAGIGRESLDAMALQARIRDRFVGQTSLEFAAFYYSGDGPHRAAFRAPWGRWPKWSELYTYTLIGESTPGRLTVAAWENIAAPRLQLLAPVGERAHARLGVLYLLAPQPDWEPRGVLTQAELTVHLAAGVDAHLLWEMLDPGAFHDGRHGLPPLTTTVHFLRWQVAWAL